MASWKIRASRYRLYKSFRRFIGIIRILIHYLAEVSLQKTDCDSFAANCIQSCHWVSMDHSCTNTTDVTPTLPTTWTYPFIRKFNNIAGASTVLFLKDKLLSRYWAVHFCRDLHAFEYTWQQLCFTFNRFTLERCHLWLVRCRSSIHIADYLCGLQHFSNRLPYCFTCST